MLCKEGNLLMFQWLYDIGSVAKKHCLEYCKTASDNGHHNMAEWIRMLE